MAETSSFAHEIILKLDGRILVIIKGKIKLVALKLFCGVYIICASHLNLYRCNILYFANRPVPLFNWKVSKSNFTIRVRPIPVLFINSRCNLGNTVDSRYLEFKGKV